MPELPEVEVLVRHLAPLLHGKTIREVTVGRERVIRPTGARKLVAALRGKRFQSIERCGKFILFHLGSGRETIKVLGHLGMTGRMYLRPARESWPKHAAVVLNLGRTNFVYEDTRYFGRFTLDISSLDKLGPEPLGKEFSIDYLREALRSSAQAIKVKLLDQSLVAGVGNIYASEALHAAGISPRRLSRRLKKNETERLRLAIIDTLRNAIEQGSTIPLDYAGTGSGDGLFYYGSSDEGEGNYEERLRVYDREGLPCHNCRNPIRRIVQAARSTFYCPQCQH